MGNVSSKLLGIFVQKRLRILYIPVKQSTDGGGGVGEGVGGGGGKRVKQEYRRPQVSQPGDDTFTFCLFLSSIVLKSLYSSYNKKKKN